jgi:cardiolipin synthase
MNDLKTKQGFTKEEIERIYGCCFIGGNGVELLWKGKETFQRIFDSVKEAKELICLEFYIFRNDETGMELSELLIEKSRQGVGVYILYDHFGSFGTPLKFWRMLKSEGIKIMASRPFRWSMPLRYIHRDHKKLLIIDGHTAFTGGLNIANEYRGFHLRRAMPWRDTGIMIKGPAAWALLDAFRRMWNTMGGGTIKLKRQETGIVPGAKDALPVMPIFAHSGKGRRRIRRLLYYSINHAKESILLTTAYFTPSRRMIETLEDATRRGVRVRLLVPGESDVPAAWHAGRAFYTRLLKRGVEIYNYMGEVLHAKAYVFDCCWSIVGSANLDFQSLRWNDEGNVGILDKGFGEEMTGVFNEDLKHSIGMDLKTWSERPLCDKLKEHFFSLFRRRL